ncbi:MAG: hypothetical protein ACI8V2_000463 [Candidatus Latescibacterota bacterium]|jgi:hypothetical protein
MGEILSRGKRERQKTEDFGSEFATQVGDNFGVAVFLPISLFYRQVGENL